MSQERKPFLVALTTTTPSRLPSMCERIRRALNAKGHNIIIKDVSSFENTKTFEADYKLGVFDCDAIILKMPSYVMAALTDGNKRSAWDNYSVRPYLSYLINYSDALHKEWVNGRALSPKKIRSLPSEIFGANEHHIKSIDEPSDEVLICGQIIKDILYFL